MDKELKIKKKIVSPASFSNIILYPWQQSIAFFTISTSPKHG